MKTDQRMSVALCNDVIRVWHKSQMGSLTDLFRVGNAVRMAEGKTAANITHFVRSERTQEFLSVMSKELAIPVDEIIKTVGRGKAARTEAGLHFLIYAAEYLSPTFHFYVIDTFINSKILAYRDDSGDQFKALNISIDNHLPDREGKDNKGVYIQVAKLIKNKIEPEDDNWNSATAEQLRERTRIEQKLVDYLEMGFIKDWEHLKQVIIDI